ncbi:MAG: hypothetical protein PHG57_06545 [Eubacteriales bacterium]|jgi:hypothetical protein|nr:hypothetical protein [Eubacteriales bacterium]
MTISEVKRQTRLSEWRGQIQEQQSSGLTVKDWCEQRGYGQGRFYYWLRLVRTESIDRYKSEEEVSLVRVDPSRLPASQGKLASCVGSQSPGIVIRYGNAAAELPAGTQTATIAELLKALSDA